jgi:hypothetical protein
MINMYNKSVRTHNLMSDIYMNLFNIIVLEVP